MNIGHSACHTCKDDNTGPAIIGEYCEIRPNVYVGPYTSLGERVRLANSKVENNIVMEDTLIDFGRIIDSLIGKNVEYSTRAMPRVTSSS